MKTSYSVEVDMYNPMALAHCFEQLAEKIHDFEYDWTLSANGGGITYGMFLNIDIERKEIEISNQPEFGSEGDDLLEDVIEAFEENEIDCAEEFS